MEGTLKAQYIYNAQGQRTRKTIFQADGITIDSITVYHYDLMGYLIEETTDTGTLIKDYLWQEGLVPVAQIDNTAGTDTLTYLHTDHLMTNRLATAENQQVIWRWEGEAFGNTQAQELTSIQVNLRFPGQYIDSETNLHYNWNRYYDPNLGRYITSDPIGLEGGQNTYNYVLQNPLNNYDPYGEIAFIPWAVRGILWYLCYTECVDAWNFPDAPGCDNPVEDTVKAACAIKCLVSKPKVPKRRPGRTKKKPKKEGKQHHKKSKREKNKKNKNRKNKNRKKGK